MTRQRPRIGHALGQRAEPARVLQRIARRHQPPQPVELQPFYREQTCAEVGLVRRVERAAKQADAHARRVQRQDEARTRRCAARHGLICPVPCTRYLKLVSCSTPTGPRACSLPVAMPISAPKPNSPPSANWVEALCSTMAESTSLRNLSAVSLSSVTIASV